MHWNGCPRPSLQPRWARAQRAVVGELLARVRAELPAVGQLGEREQVLVAAWLTGLRSARTRLAYAGDVVAWLGWLAGRDTGVLAAGRMHVDLWAATQLDAGAAASSVRRRLSALSSFYRYCAAHDLIGRVPTDVVARPVVDPDYTATVGLDRDQARALIAAAAADTGAQALRTTAVELRTEKGLTLEQVADRLLVSMSKLSRMETGHGVATRRDIRDLWTGCERAVVLVKRRESPVAPGDSHDSHPLPRDSGSRVTECHITSPT